MSFPPLDTTPPAGGYAWWYVDALSDDGRYGLTIIAFVGSVFSPYYAWANERRGGADPLEHCAINVALYGPRGRWSMTERGAGHVARDARRMRVGPSALTWDGGALVLDLDEWSVPIPRRIRGRIRVTPRALTNHPVALDPDARHRWHPVAPSARVEAALDAPRLRWRGTGYLDHNQGDEPLADGFQRWHWSRTPLRGGDRAVVLYDMTLRRGGHHGFALRADADGRVEPLERPAAAPLPRSRWGVARGTRSDDGRARVAATLEDTPFYARSLVTTRLDGQAATGVHESLSLDRFRRNWVRVLLPFRMPRRP